MSVVYSHFCAGVVIMLTWQIYVHVCQVFDGIVTHIRNDTIISTLLLHIYVLTMGIGG